MMDVDWSQFWEVVAATVIGSFAACVVMVMANTTFYTIYNKWKRDKR